MTSLPGRLGAVIATALALCACGADATAPDGPFTPGISGAPLAGRLEVIVVDEETHELVPSSEITMVDAAGTELATRDAPGFAAIEDARITGLVSVRVVATGSWEGTTTWVGVAADRVVIPVSRSAPRIIEGRVVGADTLGAADVVVGPLDVPRFTSFGALDRAVSGTCAPAADGSCHFSALAGEGASRVAATVRDASGAPIAFGIGELSSDAIEISLLDAGMRAPVVMLDLGAPLPSPPAGLDAVVGVPGLAIAERIRFLPQTPASDGAIGVPELAGSLADASWWVLLEARSSAVPDARSVVLQRGIRDSSGVRDFAELLVLPPAMITDGVVQLSAVPGASLYAIECRDGVAATHTMLVFDVAVGVPVGEGCDTVRVRAIDAPGANGSALDLDAAERSVQRFSEIVIPG